MQSGDVYIFTLRDTIRSEPRISQERVYLTPYDYKLMSCSDFLFSAEKDKGKKADKSKLKIYKDGLMNKSKQDYFTDGGIYIKFLDTFVETKEGWGNLKKK